MLPFLVPGRYVTYHCSISSQNKVMDSLTENLELSFRVAALQRLPNLGALVTSILQGIHQEVRVSKTI